MDGYWFAIKHRKLIMIEIPIVIKKLNNNNRQYGKLMSTITLPTCWENVKQLNLGAYFTFNVINQLIVLSVNNLNRNSHVFCIKVYFDKHTNYH